MKIELIQKKLFSKNNVNNSDTEMVFYELLKFTEKEFKTIPEEPRPIMNEELLLTINEES